MLADLHIHTECSCDSEAKIEQYVRQATAIGLQMLCFTDHVDFNKNDYGYNYYNPKKFFEDYNCVKAGCKDRIKLCAGIEFSEPHLYAEKLKQLSNDYSYDYIIGSVHWIGDLFPCQEVRKRFSTKEFYTLYWKEILNTVKQGGFDALGHIDFPKRYYGEIYYTESMMNEIFKYLLDKDMVPEINTSSLRKGNSKPMPGDELLEIYKANGGQYVTIGSDAHEVKDLGADIHIAKTLVEAFSLQEAIYENRNRIPVTY